MPQRLNYSAHVCDELRQMVSNMAKNGNFPNDRMAIIEWIKDIDSSIKYQLPDNGEYISHSKPLPIGMVLQRLPYPSISLEVPYSQSADPSVRAMGLTVSTRRHILCREAFMEKHGIDKFGRDVVTYNMDSPEPNGVHIQTVIWLDDNKEWTPSNAGAFIPYSEPVVIDSPTSRDKRRYGFTSAFAVLPDYSRKLYEDLGDEKFIQDMSIDIADEVKITIEFLQVLACRNISEIECAPPRVLNAHRRRKNKTPFDTVRILTVGDVVIGGARSASESNGEFKVREHMRCGHIRRLPDHQIWVSDCIVAAGSPLGRTAKTYALG